MKKSILMIFTLLFCFTAFSEEKNVYPIELQDKTVYINSAGKLINNLKTLDEKKKQTENYSFKDKYNYLGEFKNGYAYAIKRIMPDYYVPYVENGVTIEGASECISGSFGGIVDKNGKEIISFTLSGETQVSDKTVRCQERYVSDAGNSYSLYGYKNLKDKWIIKPQYKYADHFRHGYAEVSYDKKNYFLIDKSGKVCLDNNYSFIYVLSKKLLIVSYDKNDFFICDLKGNRISEDFNLLKIIDDKMSLASNESGKFYINDKGKFLFFKDYY